MLRVVGAGVGRTGTASLKHALELLLGGRCYHMLEVLATPDDDLFWTSVVRGERRDFDAVMGDCTAAVDWPSSAFWRELASESPDALILLSTRETPERWWTSYEATIVRILKERSAGDDRQLARHAGMVIELFEKTFTPGWDDRAQAIAAYERHNSEVRASAGRSPIGRDRLLEWRPGDGWAPICRALGVSVPGEPFPHENSTADFNARAREASR
jgi:hypothetical protein